MYGNSLIRTPSQSLENGFDSFQGLFNQLLNHRYRLLKRLGQGGFGQTFLAVDEHNRSLACVVKQLFLRPNPTYQRTTSERFHQEVKRLADASLCPKRFSVDTNDSLTLKSIHAFVQKTPAVSEATVYLEGAIVCRRDCSNQSASLCTASSGHQAGCDRQQYRNGLLGVLLGNHSVCNLCSSSSKRNFLKR